MRNLLYRLYETRLERQLDKANIPQHIAVMLDGNRRWAGKKSQGGLGHGHLAGAQKIFEFLSWCDQLGVPVITLYLLSTDNLIKREKDELEALLSILKTLSQDLAGQKSWRIRLVGDRKLIPADLLDALEESERQTATVDGATVNLAIGYGGRQEITEAMRSIINEHLQAKGNLEELPGLLTPELIAQHLYTSDQPDPDLIIRTSGEQRLSGFLLWQSSNSELYFEEALWPDFRKVDFLRAVRSFARRQRRFGG